MQDERESTRTPDFGTLLRRYRLAAGLSQEALAERARMSANGIGALERGYRRGPQRETVDLLAGALELDAEQRRAFALAARSGTPRRRGASVAVGPWPSAGKGGLPIALTNFVGRKIELDEIVALVREHRLVTITGPGGIGKTQTALHVAGAVGEAASGGVCFVGFAPVSERSLVTPAIASALGLQKVPNRPLLETLVAFLKDKSQLLILDNCEHVIAEVAQVTEALLLGAPFLRILAASREPLLSTGERTYRLPSLTEDDAVALFADRAQAVDAHFSLTGENTVTVGEICRQLDGIPLAIELAAAHVNALSVTALAEKLDDRFRILIGGQRTSLPRQQTMRATIDWSYELLSPPERRLFERLSVFVGGATLAAATGVCTGEEVAEADVLDLMASLVDKSLVIVELSGDQPRYKMLQSFRQYARDRLAERGEESIVEYRHAIACLELAEWLNRAFDSEVAVAVSARCNEESANWRAALHWALSLGNDVLLGQRLAGALGPVFSFFLATAEATFFFRHVEGRSWIAEALELVNEETPQNAVAALKLAEARIAGNLREYWLELESSREALAHYRSLGDSLGIVRAQVAVIHALLYLGQSAEAKATIEEALPLARELNAGSRFTLACILRLKALAVDDIFAARAYVTEALEIHDELGHRSSYPMALLDLSECEFRSGNSEQALRLAEEALAAAPPSNAFLRYTGLYAISLYLTSSARYDEAKQYAHEALDLACEHDAKIYVAWVLEQLAVIAGPLPASARLLGFAEARLTSQGSARLPFLQEPRDVLLGALHDALGAQSVAKLMAEGARMTEERAVEELSL